MFIIFLGALSDSEKDLVNQLFKEYNVKLFNISLSILHSKQDAEDALAQTFLKIMDHIDQIEKIPCHKRLPFCVIMVRHASIDLYRKNQKVIPIDFIESIEDIATDTTEETFFKNYDEQTLLKAIRGLSSEDRYLLELRLEANLSYKDIGELMNMNEAAARKRFQRALEKLNQLLLSEGYVHE